VKVLGLDTSTLTASVAIVDDERLLASTVHAASPTASAKSGGRTSEVLVAIDEACRTAGLSPRELDAVAIGAGPGSFTGLRIGMATAKGIAFAAKLPLWAVSSLAALAFGRGHVAAVLDARKGEVFAGVYRDGILDGVERVLAPDAVIDLAPAFVGDARAAYPVLAPLTDRWTDATPSGEAIARLALAGARVDVLAGGVPTYIRPSEAEVRYPDGVPGALRRR
jgi:tRNA threonylcarbamoyladenosine biosynthesis protein TsaB